MKDIKGYEGLYAVTSCGKVWSYRSQKFLKLQKHKYGYLLVSLCKEGKQKTFLVHRLVADTYIANISNKTDINHKDENKENNCVNNLEWVTHNENMTYGTMQKRAAQSRQKQVYCVELNKIYDSITAAHLDTGVNRGNISSCCSGRYKTAGGYHWEYIKGE